MAIAEEHPHRLAVHHGDGDTPQLPTVDGVAAFYDSELAETTSRDAS